MGRRLLALLSVEPVLVLGLLAHPDTHDLVRYYGPDAATATLPVASTGPVFWMHLVYSNVMIIVGTWLFLATMLRLSRTYLRMSLLLVGAALLPWAANLLHNFEVGWFARIDLTPFAFTFTGVVLFWGLFQERLVDLAPLARTAVVDSMSDAVFVLDAFDRIVDVNPAGARLLDRRRSALLGLPLAGLLPRLPGAADGREGEELSGEVSLGDGVDQQTFDVRHQVLTDHGGRPAGDLVVLRDITERVQVERRLQDLLSERTRVVASLQDSLVPRDLPVIPGTEVAGRYDPAGDGREIGGDFFEIFPLDAQSWGLVLGDISGKGAEAAAVTALARYTLRTLAHAKHPPSTTLRELNARLLAATEVERHCTLVYGVARPDRAGIDVTLSLAGHHQPLVVRSSAGVEAVGRLGTALGLLEDPELYDTELRLEQGDTICLFTDGLVEARNDTELFGADRVTAILFEQSGKPLSDVCGELVRGALAFRRADTLTDDLAILLLRASADRP